jgi:hypothetical protein
MKKLLATLLVLALSPVAHADVFSTTGTGMDTIFHVGKLDIHIPLNSAQVAYLYDAQALQSLVGAETTVLSIWKLNGTAGAVTSLQGQGTPFLGLNLAIDNPLAAHLSLGSIQLGAFGGYDFRAKSFMVGPKAAVAIF